MNNDILEKYALMNSIRDMQNDGCYVWEIARKLNITEAQVVSMMRPSSDSIILGARFR